MNYIAIRISPAALCGSGMYYSIAARNCLVCPDNSIGVESGLSECPCEMGYYRAPGEEADFPCTRNDSHIAISALLFS